jgi:hypothetical protein
MLCHLRRCPDADRQRRVRLVQKALLDRVTTGGAGLPTHWRTARGQVFAEHRETQAATALLMLDAFDLADVRRLAARDDVRKIAAGSLAADAPDLPTNLTLLGRCRWVWR